MRQVNARWWILTSLLLALGAKSSWAIHAGSVFHVFANPSDLLTPLGKKYVLCEEGTTPENAWRDLVDHKLSGNPLVGSSARLVDFGATVVGNEVMVNQILDKVLSGTVDAPTSSLKRPFVMLANVTVLKRGDHFAVCSIVAINPDMVGLYEFPNSLTASGEIEFPDGKRIPAKSTIQPNGKIRLPDPNGSLIDDPNPPLRQAFDRSREPLGRRYVICDEGATKETALQNVMTHSLGQSRVAPLVAKPVSFGKATILESEKLATVIRSQTWENEFAARPVALRPPLTLFSQPVAFQTGDHWQACFVVGDEFERVGLMGQAP
jgi:hypothetical protein